MEQIAPDPAYPEYPEYPERPPSVAYFSMEIGLDAGIPTYSGGLGVLAGDTLRAAADGRLPMVAVTLVHREGYLRQHLDALGNQTESPAPWSPETRLMPLPQRVTVHVEGRPVCVRAWRYGVRGVTGHEIPVYLLDTDLPENDACDRQITDRLYGGDAAYRLSQEVVLGLGGIAMLRALGHRDLRSYHMNEGHSAFLTLALLAEETGEGGPASAGEAERQSVRRRCVFTTHTPVPEGHDRFPAEMVRRVLGDNYADAALKGGAMPDGMLNMTHLALAYSRYVNGVARRHGQVSRILFPGYPINSITNGVHAATWVAPPFEVLFDRHFPEWREENLSLRHAVDIPAPEVQQAHLLAKQELLTEVERRTGVVLRPDVLTIGFARRATGYKRPELFFTDLGRLRQLAEQAGPLQVIFAGKAHPDDERGKANIRRVFEAGRILGSALPVVYLEEYDMAVARKLCAGVDLWLNTPQRPREASGTSGMKAALNGVPSLSVLDGWWVEGHVEGVTGWAIGDRDVESDPAAESASLYDKLDQAVLPLFYGRPTAYAEVMRSTIALNGSFFNAQRMIQQYAGTAYRL